MGCGVEHGNAGKKDSVTLVGGDPHHILYLVTSLVIPPHLAERETETETGAAGTLWI
jgi:hypothetical protein